MRWMLDTNTVSDMLRGHPRVMQRVARQAMADLGVSAVTEAELRYGIARRPEATRLALAVHQLLLRVDTAPWDSAVACRYGALRAQLEREGRSLGALDLQIAAHAMALGATLVTRDRAFAQVPALVVEDWTA